MESAGVVTIGSDYKGPRDSGITPTLTPTAGGIQWLIRLQGLLSRNVRIGICAVLPERVFFRPLRGLLVFHLPPPTACAVGCILSPLRGWMLAAFSLYGAAESFHLPFSSPLAAGSDSCRLRFRSKEVPGLWRQRRP